MLAQEPDAWLVKPVRSSGIYTALAVASHRSKQRQDVQTHMERLRLRARVRDSVEAAVMEIMHRDDCSRDEAFIRLRKTAMDSRVSLAALSERMCQDQDTTISRLHQTRNG
jgi:AmiR/NasT family two-component response regulator